MKQYTWWIVGIALFVGIIGGYIYYLNRPSHLDPLAQCIADKGATFYGAFWCPHCQDQKKLFGNASRLLPYVECSTPDGRGTLQVCTQNNVTGYPTWVFADGSRQSGELTLEELATKTGCTIPATQ